MTAEQRAFALSDQPANTTASHLYATLGFSETERWEGDEIITRLSLQKGDNLERIASNRS